MSAVLGVRTDLRAGSTTETTLSAYYDIVKLAPKRAN